MAPGGRDALKQEARTWTVLAVGGHEPRAFSWSTMTAVSFLCSPHWGSQHLFIPPGFLPTVYNQGWQSSIHITPTCSRLPPTSYLWIHSLTLPGSLQKVPVSTL